MAELRIGTRRAETSESAIVRTGIRRTAFVALPLLLSVVVSAGASAHPAQRRGPVAFGTATMATKPELAHDVRISSHQADAAWTVFTPADADTPMSGNRLANPGFEAGETDHADDWRDIAEGYEIDPNGGRGEGRALLLRNPVEAEVHGALQVITLDQTDATPIYLSAWSRAEDVSGVPNADYSVYLDLRYTDDTRLYAQRLHFDVGTHGWQHLSRFIVPDKPVAVVYVHCHLRNSHSGTAWFDDLMVAEVSADVVTFDDTTVAVVPPPGGVCSDGARGVPASTNDGLTLNLSGHGAAVCEVELDGHQVGERASGYLGGVIVRDVASGGDFIHPGGTIEECSGSVLLDSEIEELELYVGSEVISWPDRIEVRTWIDNRSTAPQDRAVSVYYALPMSADGWTWYDDMRTQTPVLGRAELANFGRSGGLGATGMWSKYPWAAIGRSEGGIALAVPVDEPRVMRLVHNPATGQLFAAFDLGLGPMTNQIPSSASARLVLYRFDPEWGFRAAAQGYYDRFPQYFERRIPPEREGLWVAFSDLSPIPDIADFGIGIHELGGLDQIAFDDSVGILSFRYVAEPWSHWLKINDETVDPEVYDDVLDYLHRLARSGDRRAQASLSSGFHDEDGRLVYQSTERPWCRGTSGCAVFTVNPDPDITHADYPLNKAHLEWGEAERETHRQTGLDGEYIDSYLSAATVLDLRREHFRAADTPLTFRTSDHRVGIPQVFATTEFARWVTDEVHDELGKLAMANGILQEVPWGADLFDFMGAETNWMRTGRFVPESDERMMFRRALAHQRPYGMLMNINFDWFGAELVERYMQASLFYAMYPSLFSHNAAENRYWDNPALYERDRPLFRHYVPLIRTLSKAGWEPVTRATTDDKSVIVERYGRWPNVYFALRNLQQDSEASVNVTVQARRLGMPPWPVQATRLLAGGTADLRPLRAGESATTVVLAPGAVEILHVVGHVASLPLLTR